MAQSESNNNEPSKLRRLLNSNMDQSAQARSPRATSMPPSQNTSSNTRKRRALSDYKFAPAFWTIASVISLAVNIGLLIALLVILQVLGGPKATMSLAQDQAAGLLSGLYVNFVKMDQATISTMIPVDDSIPLNIEVPVRATTRIVIAESAVIPNAHVRINTGGLNIDANAEVTLPANTPLVVSLDFPLTVQNSVPIHLNVPVNIPLNHTELHEPFVGLQKVVEPYYCFLQPNATVNGINFCSPTANLVNPAEQTTP